MFVDLRCKLQDFDCREAPNFTYSPQDNICHHATAYTGSIFPSFESYVTEELMKKLNLDIECNEMLNLNTFGSSKFAKVVTFFVSLKDYDDVEESALTHKVICSPLRTRVDIGNHAHL